MSRPRGSTFLAGYAFITAASLWNIASYGTNGADLVVWSSIGLYLVIAAAFAWLLFGRDMRAPQERARPMA